jgi:hypothetical protein
LGHHSVMATPNRQVCSSPDARTFACWAQTSVCCSLRPTGPGRTFGSQTGKIDLPVPPAARGHWMQWGEKAPAPYMGPRGLGQQRAPACRSTRQVSAPAAREGDPLRCGASTPQRSVPLALASLVLGSRGAFTRFFEISCCRFQISIRRPEAHFRATQRSGTLRVPRADRDNCFAVF